jgi:hypothetical protein
MMIFFDDNDGFYAVVLSEKISCVIQFHLQTEELFVAGERLMEVLQGMDQVT